MIPDAGKSGAARTRATKIVATLGPNVDKPGVLAALVNAGINVVRLNMSHGAHAEHERRARAALAAARAANRTIGVLLDLSGPKLRTGTIPDGKRMALTAGDHPVLTATGTEVEGDRIPVSIPSVLADLREGDAVLLDDGKLRLVAEERTSSGFRCRVIVGGPLKSHAGLNLPGTPLSVASITGKDKIDLAFGLSIGVDFVALSFVRSPSDMASLRKLTAKAKRPPLLIAKIEMPEALARLDAIVEASDGIMVARGDLGVELPTEEVPPAQKRILAAAHDRGRLSITATQMLESMVGSPTPTRAEASDVANAVFDGTDAVMLSEETAVGSYPAQAVAAMASIASRAERSPYQRPLAPPVGGSDPALAAVLRAAVTAARDVSARAILVFTASGRTAILASKLRPTVPIVAVTHDAASCRALALAYDVTAVLIPEEGQTDQLLRHGEDAVRKAGLARRGERVVVVFGREFSSGVEHSMKVHKI